MSETVIKVENLSKQYRLGVRNTGTISHDLNRWWAKARGREDPFAKIGEVNDRTTKGESEYVWALKDINFEVKQGEVLGIIGRNGAGKSTLLKLLSKVTRPTTGSIKMKGRVASLLEVGTGFHPELTGRENVFLNGAILGMTKKEIKRKFDEIVDFAGVERYIDTPVKRYSSGMYVRLAFAVAAHLEPEILIVDEVLAVGDAEFQKKCLGKMGEVSKKDGRTILFVSHNMKAVETLCPEALFLMNGQIQFEGETTKAINLYLDNYIKELRRRDWNELNAPGNDCVRLLSASIKGNTNSLIFQEDPISFEFIYEKMTSEPANYSVTIHVTDEKSNLVFVSGSTQNEVYADGRQGIYKFSVTLHGNLLHYGYYTINRLLFVKNRGTIVHEFKDILSFEISQNSNQKQVLGWKGKKEGIIQPKLPWKMEYYEINQPALSGKRKSF